MEIEFSCTANIEIINKKIIDIYNIGFTCLPAHLVILEAGGNPNKDKEIFLAYEQYYKDFGINNEMEIDVVCNEAIF